MSRTSLIRAKGVRDGTEQKVTENYAATLAQNLYDKEKRERIAADDTLQTNINNEATARENADNRLQTNINNEATARENADNTLQTNINLEASARTAADDAIANGTREITPHLGNNTTYGNIDLGKNALSLYGPMYGGANSLQEMAAMIVRLNGGDTVDGSVNKKIKDAINAFATIITEDGTINTYKEVLDWIAEHGADFAALVEQVNTNTGRIATLETNMPTSATAAEIREAWNATPVTPTVTISGEYDSMDSILTISSTEMAKLEALEPNTEFNLVINATGVDYSGAAKRVTSIEGNYAEPGGYVFVTSGGSETSIPLWDGEDSYNEYACVLLSHFDDPDMGEIQAISW